MTIADDLEQALRLTRIYAMDPARRRGIAEQLGGYGITPAMLRLVWAEARESTRDADVARAMFSQAVARPETVREVYDDVQERLEQARRDADRESSGLAWASDTNPYGWAKPDLQRHLDHEVPGEWNPFRQSWNMTSSEMLDAGTRDPRRRGCSRVEVLGEFDKARIRRDGGIDADPFWDGGTVEALRQPPEPAEPERDIYR